MSWETESERYGTWLAGQDRRRTSEEALIYEWSNLAGLPPGHWRDEQFAEGKYHIYGQEGERLFSVAFGPGTHPVMLLHALCTFRLTMERMIAEIASLQANERGPSAMMRPDLPARAENLESVAEVADRVLSYLERGATHFDGYETDCAQLRELLNRHRLRPVAQDIRLGMAENQRLRETIERLLKERAEPSPRAGFIYILLAENGLYKIGRSNNFDKRIAKIGIQVPFEIDIEYGVAVKDAVYTELLFHEKFREKRVKGEWFRLNEEDLVWIKSQPGW